MNSSCTVISTEDKECNVESQPNTQETVDPDYLPAFVERNAQPSLKEHEQDAKENAVKTIKHIIRKQFALEMRLKEQEIEAVDDNLRQTKLALDRIRACVLARYYGMSEVYRPPNNSWSKLRRSKRESKQLRSLPKTANSSSSRNVSTSSSSNLAKQNRQLSSDGKKFEAKFEDVNKSIISTPLDAQKSASLNVNSENSGISCKLSQSDHTYGSNFFSGQYEGTKGNEELLNCKISMESIGNLNSKSLFTESGNSFKANASSPDVSQTTRNLTATSALTNQMSTSLESHVSTSTDLADTKIKFVRPEPSNVQMNNSIRASTFIEPTLTKSSAQVNTLNDIQSNAYGFGSRFYVKKRVIIGNTSKYIPPDRREDNDKSTHKWMVYVRGPPHDPHIDTYIKKVWFFLHPSYRPNDIVEINKPPFHLTRRGWGEFPIRVQLHFIGSWNKRVDIIHELKLDKTYTGLQTLGAETVVDLEIDRKTFEDIGIPVPMEVQGVCGQSSVETANSTVSNQNLTKLMRDYSSGSVLDKDKESSSNPEIKKIKLESSSSTSSDPSVSFVDSRCNNPTLSLNFFQIDDNLAQQLKNLTEKIPLINPEKDPNFSFRAPSVSQYFEWPIGKQRASEWQRALKIRDQLRKQCISSTISTKEVMIWCRRNGYTPQSDLAVDADSRYCKVCGRLEGEECSDTVKLGCCPGKECSESETTSSTLSSALDLLTQVEKMDRHFESSQNTHEEDIEVDVVCIPPTKQALCIPSSHRQGLLIIPLTQEEQWVRDVCNEIGVSVRPETLQGVEVNTVDCMLLSAVKQFMKQLMHTAVALSNDTNSSLDCKLLVPRHIHQAINHVPHFDFLTNAYLGIDVEKQCSE